MTDQRSDPHPDSPPARDQPDIERDRTPTEPTVSPDSAGGAGGTVRNQDDDAQ